MKEAFIQELEMRITPEMSLFAPPTNVTVLFFNEIDSLKRVIDRLTTSNKQYQEENSVLRKKNENLQKRLDLL